MTVTQEPGWVERRVARRFRAGFPATVRCPGQHSAAICVDISAGGLGLRLGNAPPVGVEIRVEVRMPNGDTIHAIAEVVRSGAEGSDIGARFRHLAPQALCTLHSFLSRQTTTLH